MSDESTNDSKTETEAGPPKPVAEEAKPPPPEEDEQGGHGFWDQQRKLSYPLVAAVLLPPVFLAMCFLLYRDFDRLAHEPVPGMEPSGALSMRRPPPPPPPPPPGPTSAQPPSPVQPRPSSSVAMPAASVFEQIYKDGFWAKNDAGAGTSGLGSTLAATAPYRTYLQTLFKERKIKSVVDAGCGDWEFSKAIDWTGIDYKGYDIVETVIAANKKKHEAANIHFFTANITKDELPPADLLIIKQVLQHLPNGDVQKVIPQLTKYKHILIVNGVHPRTLTGDNHDIAVGEYRYLDITAPPFGLPGIKELTWWDGNDMQQVVHLMSAPDKKKP